MDKIILQDLSRRTGEMKKITISAIVKVMESVKKLPLYDDALYLQGD